MSLVDWLALILLWGAALSRIPAARTSHVQRMLWGAFTALALSRVFSAAPIVAWLDSATHMEWATLLRHLSGLTSATCLLAYVEVISRKEGQASRGRWIWPPALAFMAALVAMFAARGGRIYWLDGATGPAAGTAETGRIYLLIFDGWLMCCLAAAGWMFASYARRAPALLRVGLVISAAAMAAGVINRAHVMTVNLLVMGWPELGAQELPGLHKGTFLLCIAGITIGTSIPAYRAAKARLKTRRALRDLRPLWEAVTTQWPDIALGVRGPLQVQLLRRVLEIRDGMLALTSVTPPPASSDPGEVAQWLVAALEAARRGEGTGVPAGRIPGPSSVGGSANSAERETQWLQQVANEFRKITRRSPASLVS
ncbi:MAB_1171c family putative transporter [Nonomuraea sp. NPDC059023]|uniref:MAB_1171c family putative transporter n=1 Tax=unclassified Nonomuraea TaxID=2593643 RepID=UPI0036C9270D